MVFANKPTPVLPYVPLSVCWLSIIKFATPTVSPVSGLNHHHPLVDYNGHSSMLPHRVSVPLMICNESKKCCSSAPSNHESLSICVYCLLLWDYSHLSWILNGANLEPQQQGWGIAQLYSTCCI